MRCRLVTTFTVTLFIPPGPANAGGMNNVTVDPSGIGNASRIAPLPQPRITVPVIPHFK